ncbi:uncharacterized protein K452DRAFT_311098 [Aplosporella prunicola CBS 121167]|uniref:Uncharacterized protein n=1 Tax=Aplosporella prunicola CBS 121167 TaxID=1176127 RepID=A0A6A6B4Q1_9PEZI|nr:uncharacterized protein K452DRAFT_311098 [Aplosporella prunicola CBS 121167]KAF2139169.1 hypothetical protein K452DRAFT_311098 [Aplosporella prunicola CBS 121167]
MAVRGGPCLPACLPPGAGPGAPHLCTSVEERPPAPGRPDRRHNLQGGAPSRNLGKPGEGLRKSPGGLAGALVDSNLNSQSTSEAVGRGLRGKTWGVLTGPRGLRPGFHMPSQTHYSRLLSTRNDYVR